MKKVGKTTRPFRYDLNQIPYDYTVEVTNRFKGLDLIVPEQRHCSWTVVHGQRNLVGYSPWRDKELDMTKQLTT